MSRIYDISESIDESTAVWPGDSPFSRDWVMRMDEGASCNVSTIRMSTHLGSHSDAPMHFLPGARSIDEVPLEKYLGPCRVIEVEPIGEPATVPVVTLLEECRGIKRVLFRTRQEHDAHEFHEDFCSLGIETARACVKLGIELVGIDTPSMDPFTSKDLESHKILLEGAVAILENLDLCGVPVGEYELIALPLKIRGGDSSPVRAVLRSLA